MFKPNEKTAKQRKLDQGLRQEVRESTRSFRSATGTLKQSMKSHRNYKKHIDMNTGEPFKSIKDRFENDPIYRYRMMSVGWSADMCEPLQVLLETNILGDQQSKRTREQIQAAKVSYTTHPELGEGQSSAGNPDWGRTRVARNEFRGGLVSARSGLPVVPQVANLLQQHFGMDVPTIEEEADPNEGEWQHSASKGAGHGTGNQGSWWTSSAAPTTWTTPGAAAASSDWRGWDSAAASSSAAAADQTWSADTSWKRTAESQKQQY